MVQEEYIGKQNPVEKINLANEFLTWRTWIDAITGTVNEIERLERKRDKLG